MGQSAKSNIRIGFFTMWNVPQEFKNEDTLIKALTDFYWTTTEGKFTRKQTGTALTPQFTIVDYNVIDHEVELEFYSTRRVNLDFQVELLQDYLQKNYDGKVSEVDEETWTQA